MPVASFRLKILLLLVACMCLSQLVTMLATLATTENTVRQSVDQDLRVAERTFNQLFEQRFYQLSESVQVLVDDFGFRGALASQDGPTIESALENHAARANASIAIFLEPDTGIRASTLPPGDWARQDGWTELLERIRRNDFVLAVFAIDGNYYQAVVVPVMAPARIGWVLMGFTIDEALASTFRTITDLHVSFYDPANAADPELVSTLSASQKGQLAERLRDISLVSGEGDGPGELVLDDETFLTRLHVLAEGGAPVFAVLQKSLQQEMLPYQRMERTLILLFAGVLLVSALAGIGIGGNLMAPIRRLALLAERIGAGNYAVGINVDTKDEIGKLGTALNTMQQEIATRESRIIHQTQHDDLTDLPNRYLIKDRIDTAIGQAGAGQPKFTLVMLDISRFKQINDTLGHHVGDVLLQEIASRLQRLQRTCDCAARMGGDDFLILMENTDLETSMRLVKQQFLPLLTSAHHLNDVEIKVRFNCGFVEYPTHGDTATALLRRCEIALYEAKTNPAGLMVYEVGRDESHLRQMAIVSDLDKAMTDNQLQLFYQPKLALATGELCQAEALVRWNHPVFGFLPPDEFIPVLEQTGNISKLTRWVLGEAIAQCRQWLDRGIDLVISVNLSALDLLEPGLQQQIEKLLRQADIHPRQLILEITESAIMQDPQAAHAVLRDLQLAGFGMAIDDFGTGYSSLAQLKSLPVSELKIDKSFVLNLKQSAQDAVIVKSTIELAHSMQLKVVAEGVENIESLQLLQGFGCDLAQGYYIARPMAADAFDGWYETNQHKFTELLTKVA